MQLLNEGKKCIYQSATTILAVLMPLFNNSLHKFWTIESQQHRIKMKICNFYHRKITHFCGNNSRHIVKGKIAIAIDIVQIWRELWREVKSPFCCCIFSGTKNGNKNFWMHVMRRFLNYLQISCNSFLTLTHTLFIAAQLNTFGFEFEIFANAFLIFR